MITMAAFAIIGAALGLFVRPRWLGELLPIVLAVLVAARWVTIDRIESKRQDRKADRDGDADLAAYNAYLASLRGRGED